MNPKATTARRQLPTVELTASGAGTSAKDKGNRHGVTHQESDGDTPGVAPPVTNPFPSGGGQTSSGGSGLESLGGFPGGLSSGGGGLSSMASGGGLSGLGSGGGLSGLTSGGLPGAQSAGLGGLPSSASAGGSAGRNVGRGFLARSFGGVECRVGVEFATAGDRNRVSDRGLEPGGHCGADRWAGGGYGALGGAWRGRCVTRGS